MKIKTYPTIEAMHHLDEVRGKFVQLNWKGEHWLLFASKDQHQFHNQIVAHFMTDQHLPHHWQSPEVLNFEQPALQIAGGGKFRLNWQDKQLVLSDNSMVYGRFHEEGIKESLQGAMMPWAKFAIEVY